MVFRNSAFIVLVAASFAVAQPPHGGGQHAGRSTNAVLAAIDANGDHEISTAEMKDAFASLKKLDLDKDGKLGRDEIHPETAGGDRHGGPGERDGGVDRSNIAARVKGLDKNEDGTISKSEMPDRIKQVVARFDVNEDGDLDKGELKRMTERLSVPDGDRSRGGGRNGGGPPGGGGVAGSPGGPGGGGGPPSSEQVVRDAMEFDANKDGMLSKTELQKFAEEHIARRGPGGREHHGPGGPGGHGGGGRAEGGNRPTRPARPE